MIVNLKLAREYAQLWAEYDTLKLMLNKFHSHEIQFQIISDMSGVIGNRLSEINQELSANYRKIGKKQ